MTDHARTAILDWDDPDMLRARANVIGWERVVSERHAELGDVVAALDAVRQLRQRFPGIRAIDKAAVEMEFGDLRAAQQAAKSAKESLAQAEAAWSKYQAPSGSSPEADR